MGYTLLILRDPPTPENPITSAEWQEFMRLDPDLWPSGENSALLRPPPGLPRAESWPAWLTFYGCVYIKNASAHTMPKIFEIAKRLNGRVKYREQFYDSAQELMAGIPEWARDVIYPADES